MAEKKVTKINVLKELRTYKKDMEDILLEFKLEDKVLPVIIKQYLPVEDKKALIQVVTETAFIEDEETGLKKVDNYILSILKEYLIIKSYTDIKLGDEVFEMYDLLTCSGLKDEVLYGESGIPDTELIEIQNMIDYEIEELMRIREVSTGLGYKLEKIVDSINGGMNDSIEAIKKMDLSAIDRLKA